MLEQRGSLFGRNLKVVVKDHYTLGEGECSYVLTPHVNGNLQSVTGSVLIFLSPRLSS